MDKYISIHALREEGDLRDNAFETGHQKISIHALREEGDVSARLLPAWIGYFYPRPPRGGRQTVYKWIVNAEEFLSTPSARRATAALIGRSTASMDFYPRPPRGGRPPTGCYAIPLVDFYPRPPRGGRLILAADVKRGSIFLSTPSARRATMTGSLCTCLLRIFLSTPSARRATKET